MAVAKLPLTSFENPGLGQTLLRWRWLLVFMVVAWALAAQIPGYLALGPSQSLGNTAVDHGADQPGFWYSSPGMRVDTSAGQLHWESQATGNHWASRALAVPGDAEFVQLRFCLAKDVAPEAVAVMLASVREGALDFTRQYRVNSFYAGAAGECFAEPIPRRPGDGPAVLQVQLLDAPAALYLQSLEFEALRENPRWR
ncbi:MAG: hypothetical protein NWQ45_14750, partial [Congregibacter sp.]|nr:hypothetical protein [Congregibacter sp.]